MIDKKYWKQALENARQEYSALFNERQNIDRERAALDERQREIDNQLVQHEQTITSLQSMVNEEPAISPDLAAMMHEHFANRDLQDDSLANSCREILKAIQTFATPMMVRDALLQAGYDESKHSNLLASIHSVLKRLEQSGEAIRATDTFNNAVYKWNTSEFKRSPLKHVGQRTGFAQRFINPPDSIKKKK